MTSRLGEARVKQAGSMVSELISEDPSFDEWTADTKCLLTIENSQNLLSGPGTGILAVLPNLPASHIGPCISLPHLSLKPALPGKTATTWLRSGKCCILWMEGILQEHRELSGMFRSLAMGQSKMRWSQADNRTDRELFFAMVLFFSCSQWEMLWALADEVCL